MSMYRKVIVNGKIILVSKSRYIINNCVDYQLAISNNNKIDCGLASESEFLIWMEKNEQI